MPRRKQRKIHAPLKQDIKIYREMQKDISPFRSTSTIVSTSIQSEQTNPISSSSLSTSPGETLTELVVRPTYKKPRDKNKNIELPIKNTRLDYEEEIDLNLITPNYLNISQKEFNTILNTPEKVFNIVRNRDSDEYECQLDDELINMTDEDFEKIIENPENLEDIWNSQLDDREKSEQELKETIFKFLLETEKQLEIEQNANSSSFLENTSNTRGDQLLERKKQVLRKKRTSQKNEKDLLEKLNQDLKILKEKEGTKDFNAELYDKIENEIMIKTKKLNRMNKQTLYNKKYLNSDKGKNISTKYGSSENAKQSKKIYNESEYGKETKIKYEKSEHGKEVRKRYYESEKGKESHKKAYKKYRESEKGKEAQIKINEKRRQKRLEDKLRAERDPEFKKLLDEKKRIKAEKDRVRYHIQKKNFEHLFQNNN